MATRRQTENQVKRSLKRAGALDTLADKLLKGIDSSYDDRRLINAQNSKFQAIIDRQLDLAKGVSKGQIVDFIADLRIQRRSNDGMSTTRLDVDANDLFTQNIGDIFGYFQDIYKNRYIEVSDLKFISKFIPSLGEAVKTTLDSVVTSDDVSESITRKLVFDGVTDPKVTDPIIAEIKRMEKSENLLKKLKNIAYKKTLITGSYYVYCIGYKELFEMYSKGLADGRIVRKDSLTDAPENIKIPNAIRRDKKAPKGGNTDKNPLGLPAKESSTEVFNITMEPGLESFGSSMGYAVENHAVRKCNYGAALESTFDDLRNSIPKQSAILEAVKGPTHQKTPTADDLIDAIKGDLPNIYFLDSYIPIECLDDVQVATEAGSYDAIFGAKASPAIADVNKALNDVADGVFNIGPESGSAHGQKFNTAGSYIKWIDYKYIIPVEIFGRTVGYYHITSTKKSKKGNSGQSGNGSILSNNTIQIFSQVNLTEQKKEEAIQSIVNTISSAILDQFGTKFVRKNDAFKDLIADCIIANGIVNNDYMIQFIPADYIVEFKINEDEQGHGESILANSLFPGHLLLSILVCKELNYINKSGNRTIAHISKGPIDDSSTNQIQRIIRNLQESNVTFNDLLSTNLVFSKFARDSNIAMPRDRNGNRLVEFEVQEGQQIELNTDFENKLEQMAIMGTGVPPVIMEYIGQVDVAKEIVSANIKFAGRVANLQSDLEDSTTILYKKILSNSTLDEEQKRLINTSFNFKLPRPRILANSNNADSLQTLQTMAQLAADIQVGQANEDKNAQREKDFIVQEIVRENSPFFDWNKIEEYHKIAKMKVQKEQAELNEKNANDMNANMGGSDMGGSSDMGDMGGF